MNLFLMMFITGYLAININYSNNLNQTASQILQNQRKILNQVLFSKESAEQMCMTLYMAPHGIFF